jgi:hypothetical protein
MSGSEYSIPRPRTRADCLDEARPCPWVGCRHHLAFDLAVAQVQANGKKNPTSPRLLTHGSRGRRPGLRSSAAEHVVRRWIDDAVEALALLEYTCALDVVDDHPDGIGPRRLAAILRSNKSLLTAELHVLLARRDVREGLGQYEDHAPVDAPGIMDRRHGVVGRK